MDLFGSPPPKDQNASQPLAERMRPASLEEFAGQEHLLGPGKLLSGMLSSGKLRSIIFWGPPGSGKTTLRSEEHTSELQSQSNLVCRLLLEKKKKNIKIH